MVKPEAFPSQEVYRVIEQIVESSQYGESQVEQSELTEAQREIREFLHSKEWTYFERRRLELDHRKALAMGWINHAVSYAQMGLRGGVLLNGGGIIAVPAFAEMLGEGLWARGVDWPVYAFLIFVVGLASATFSIALAYFAMIALGHAEWETISRVERILASDHNVALGGPPTMKSSDAEQTENEQEWRSWGEWLQRIAVFFGILPLLTFVAGAVIGAYIISGLPPAHS